MDISILYEYRSVVSNNPMAYCPPSGSFVHYSSDTNYYIKIYTDFAKSAGTGERLMKWTLVQ